MGNTTISTKNTTIYYPSDWLIEGGPPFSSVGCPRPDMESDDADVPLRMVYNKETEYFGVVQQGYILMESKEARDIAKYISEYVTAFQQWVEDNK